MFTPNGLFEPYCGRSNSVHFTGSSGLQFLETNSLNITGGIIQFDINTGCGLSTETEFTVELTYTNNWGSNSGDPSSLTSRTVWPILNPAQCNPTSSGCTSWTAMPPPGAFTSGIWYFYNAWAGGSIYYSGDFRQNLPGSYDWTRVTLPVPSGPVAGGRRFRFNVVRNGVASEWAISNLYIGTGCVGGCSGRGRCVDGSCICDPGFTLAGPTCVPAVQLATSLRDSFADPLSPLQWLTVTGGSRSNGVTNTFISGISSLYFAGTGTRRAVTVDLDTTVAEFMDFILLYLDNQYDVVVAFSNDGGQTWNSITSTINQAQGTSVSYAVALPLAARTPATRFMFWQPLYVSASDAFVSTLELHSIVSYFFSFVLFGWLA